jgi:hypothetical protein
MAEFDFSLPQNKHHAQSGPQFIRSGTAHLPLPTKGGTALPLEVRTRLTKSKRFQTPI